MGKKQRQTQKKQELMKNNRQQPRFEPTASLSLGHHPNPHGTTPADHWNYFQLLSGFRQCVILAHNSLYQWGWKVTFFLFSLLPLFLSLVLQLHFCANWLPMVRAGQPMGLDCWSLPTAVYPSRGRSKHDESWASRSNCDEHQELNINGFLPLTGACVLNSNEG